MRLAEQLRDDQVQAPTYSIRCSMAEYTLGRGVPGANDPLTIREDDCVGRLFEQQRCHAVSVSHSYPVPARSRKQVGHAATDTISVAGPAFVQSLAHTDTPSRP